MKKISALLLLCMAIALVPIESAHAATLDDIINDESSNGDSNTSNEVVDEPTSGSSQETNQNGNTSSNTTGNTIGTDGGNGGYVDEIKDATNLSEKSAGATKLNAGIKKVASFIVQVLSYFATACLVVRVLLDIVYIVLPFTRSFLANGYAGNPQSQGTGMQQPGMGGMGSMGMGGMGMGGMGMGGYGSSRYGMGGMGSMGMGGMGMNAMQQGMSQPGATPALGRIQWVSTAALNAAAAESVVGPNGKAVSPLKAYAKDMVIILVITPIFLVLAVTGALTDLGFLIGEMLANAVSGIGGMM